MIFVVNVLRPSCTMAPYSASTCSATISNPAARAGRRLGSVTWRMRLSRDALRLADISSNAGSMFRSATTHGRNT